MADNKDKMIVAKLADVRECCEACRAWYDDLSSDLKLEAWQTWMNHTFPVTHDYNMVHGFLSALCDHSDLSGEVIFNLCRLFIRDTEEAD